MRARVAVGLACLLATRATAKPVLLQADGTWKDEFGDEQGLTFRQNVKVGPSLTPGVRVSLGQWSWAQSFTPASDSLWTPFNDPGARLALVQVLTSGASPWQAVGLWQKVYGAAGDLTLTPGVTTTTLQPSGFDNGHRYAVRGNVEQAAFGLTGKYLLGGPLATNLIPGREYTATLNTFWCDDPACKPPYGIAGADLGVFEVAFGATAFPTPPLRLGAYGSLPPGDYWDEGVPSPATVEWAVPDPLPPGSGWEYRLAITLTVSGSPAAPPCAPNCSASVWLDTVVIMTKGRRIPVTPIFSGGCPPGSTPCNNSCLPVALNCGWDSVTVYVDNGSYLSPVFDSLSSGTRWEKMWWSVDQNFSPGWPRTPMAIKWRVGNSPDPATWLPEAGWFTRTVPNSVTCTGEEQENCKKDCQGPGKYCDCSGHPGGRNEAIFPCQEVPVGSGTWLPYPARFPMHDVGETTLYTDGTETAHATGRYFQYEVDFTGQYANDRFPPEQDTGLSPPTERHLKEARRPILWAMRAYYTPARGQVTSELVRPTQLRRWKNVAYTKDVTSGGSLTVDVLDASDLPLFTGIPSGFNLGGLDPSQYPALKLRSHIDNAGLASRRPTLLSWSLAWDTFTEPLQVDRNAINPSQHEACRITVVLTAARAGSLGVHDAAGQVVATLFRGVFDAGVRTWAWDGRNAAGETVAPGVYYVTLQAKEIRSIRTVAVVRR